MGRQFNRFILKSYVNQCVRLLLSVLTHQKYPVAFILFLTSLTSGAILFIRVTWPLVSWQHRVAMMTLLTISYSSIYLCSQSGANPAHIITNASHEYHSQQYAYDYKLYHPGRVCRTCQWTKPARSKHCSICNSCIARADHHCIWINNCIGKGNYKYFLSLLVSMITMLSYTVFLAYSTSSAEVRRHLSMVTMANLHQPITDPYSISVLSTNWDWRHVSRELLHHLNKCINVFVITLVSGGIIRTGIGMLAFVTSFFPAGLLVFHLRLIRVGMTTHESSKWGDWRQEVMDGYVYYAPINQDPAKSVSDDKNPNWVRHKVIDLDIHTQVMPPRQFCVVTEDGLSPRHLSSDIVKLVGEKPGWRHCQDMSEIRNDYNRGFWQNLVDLVLD